MEIDSPQVQDTVLHLIRRNGIQLFPVSVATGGTGLPYAPQNWPDIGDTWLWKSGSRIAKSGFFQDRYLYPPNRLIVEHGAAKIFKSKLSVEQFVSSQFPGENVEAFFSSFSWQIPSHKLYHKEGNTNVVEEHTSSERRLDTTTCQEVYISSGEVAGVNSNNGHCKARNERCKSLVGEHTSSECNLDTTTCQEVYISLGEVAVKYSNVGPCKARNERCKSLVGEEGASSELIPCNVCCTALGFCRLCCCILCCQSINVNTQIFEYIRCNAKNDGDYTCGHIAHIECAIRNSMAGTLEGNNGLDAEYYCLRCDSRTDLVPHMMKLLHSSETKNIGDNAQEVLSVCVRMLDGSKRKTALQLLHHIQAIIETKLKGGTKLKEVLGEEDTSLVTMGSEFDHWIESSKLEDEVDEVLSNLRKSQKDEYKVAEDMILAQTYCIRKMYGVTKNVGADREDEIKQEVVKLEGMKEVEKGFGRTSERNLKLHFHM